MQFIGNCMKLIEAYKLLKEEDQKIRYDMTNINGGFSDGVEIKPGSDSTTMNVSVNIFGGGQSNSLPFTVPTQISDMQQAYVAAQQTGDPVSGDIAGELEAYYNNLRTAISLEMVALMKKFDADANAVISRAVANMNKKYGQ